MFEFQFMHKFVAYYKFIKEILCLFFSKKYYSLGKRDKNVWVFGEWFGNRCCDNCLFFANYLSNNHPEIKLFWISSKQANLSALDSRVTRLEMDTSSAVSVLKKAGAVFYVQGNIDITKRPFMYHSGALVTNFWHGVPWKKIGSDLIQNPKSVFYFKLFLSLYGVDFYLSLSHEFSNILERAYATSGYNIINSGYPRNSIFYQESRVKECKCHLISYLQKKFNVAFDDSVHLIAYMPTFRDKNEYFFSFMNMTDNRINDVLKQTNSIILEKGHYVTAHRNAISDLRNSERVFMIDNDFLSQELLAASDMLITDYSSCFFDFLLLDRPIIHFLYDYDYYTKEDRGLYYKKDDVVCGDVAENVKQLESAIHENITNPQKFSKLRAQRRVRFLEYERSTSNEEIYKHIITKLYKVK